MMIDLTEDRRGLASFPASVFAAVTFSLFNVSVACGQETVDDTRVRQALLRSYEPIDLSLFRDSIRHWQRKEGRDRNDRRFRPDQIVQIAENLLNFQHPDGGWPKNVDWLIQFERSVVVSNRNQSFGPSSFDNRNVYPQIEYLMRVHEATGLERYRRSAIRGLHYILREQRPTGGWRGSDIDAITFNDDVMVGIMRLLLQIRRNAPPFDTLDQDLRKQLSQALDRAIQVTLQCQIKRGDRRTGWCQQHDHRTFQPVGARTYELPSIATQESAGVVRLLMEIHDPPTSVVAAVEDAVAWLDGAKIEGLRIEQFPIGPIRFENFTATRDRREVQDPQAPPIWARFYGLDDNRPFFCNRDGVKVDRLSEVQLERRVGYGWYGYWPAGLLATEFPAWRANATKHDD